MSWVAKCQHTSHRPNSFIYNAFSIFGTKKHQNVPLPKCSKRYVHNGFSMFRMSKCSKTLYIMVSAIFQSPALSVWYLFLTWWNAWNVTIIMVFAILPLFKLYVWKPFNLWKRYICKVLAHSWHHPEVPPLLRKLQNVVNIWFSYISVSFGPKSCSSMTPKSFQTL